MIASKNASTLEVSFTALVLEGCHTHMWLDDEGDLLFVTDNTFIDNCLSSLLQSAGLNYDRREHEEDFSWDASYRLDIEAATALGIERERQ